MKPFAKNLVKQSLTMLQSSFWYDWLMLRPPSAQTFFSGSKNLVRHMSRSTEKSRNYWKITWLSTTNELRRKRKDGSHGHISTPRLHLRQNFAIYNLRLIVAFGFLLYAKCFSIHLRAELKIIFQVKVINSKWEFHLSTMRLLPLLIHLVGNLGLYSSWVGV